MGLCFDIDYWMRTADISVQGPLGLVADMRILIADDSLVSRHLLEATLRKWNYEVTVACDGNEAWNILKGDDPPRLAILDWVMPGISGPEVCKRVREHAKNGELNYTYLLLLTSKSQREDLIEGMEAGADDYLTKPFDQHELKVRLRAGSRVIDGPRRTARTGHQRFPDANLESLVYSRRPAKRIDSRRSREARSGRRLGRSGPLQDRQ